MFIEFDPDGSSQHEISNNKIVCKQFLKGLCKFGSNCNYDHPEDEIQECQICTEKITAKRRFGILLNCYHPFCLECIKLWRAGGGGNQNKEATLACPVCMINSHQVIPSTKWIKNQYDKDTLINEFKENCGMIECKHFKKTGQCPFSTSCFYAHLDKDGKPVEFMQIDNLQMNEEGKQSLKKEATLADFITYK